MFFNFRPLRRLLIAVGVLFGCAAAAVTPGKCRLPRQIAVKLPGEVRLPLDDLRKLCGAQERTLTAEPDREKAFLRFDITDLDTPEHPQGHVVEITGRGISIRARTPAGLFYGAQKLNDLLRIHADGELPCCRIVAGAPAFDERAICFSIDRRSAAPRDLNRLKRMLKILAALRYNRALIEFGANFPAPGLYPDNENPLNEKQLDELIDFAGAHFIGIVPMLQVPGDRPIPTTGEPSESRASDGTAQVCCPRHPEVRKLLRETVRIQCARLHPKEFFFRIDWKDLEDVIRRCPRCRDGVPAKPVEHLSLLALLAGFATENGARPAFILLNVPDDLAAGIPAILPAGTPLYGLTANGRTPNAAPAGSDTLLKEIADSVKSGAGRFIVLEKPYTRDGDIAGSLYNTTPEFLGGMVQGAEAMWPSPVLVSGDPVYYFRLLHSAAATPAAGRRKATPVAIWRQLNAELGASGSFPVFKDHAAVEEMRQALRKTPERFGLAVCFGGRYYGVRLAGSPGDKTLPEQLEIPLGGVKADAVALLLSCPPPENPEEFDPARGGKRAFEYCSAAIVVIGYADGTELRKPLKYRRHFSPWNEKFGGYDRRNACFGMDGRGRTFRFDSVIVKNPHPDKPVAVVTVRSLCEHGIAPTILAVSLLDAQGGSLPASDPCDELLRLNFRP